MFDLVGFACVLRVWDVQSFGFLNVPDFWNLQDSTIVKFSFLWIPVWKDDGLGSKKIIQKMSKFQNSTKSHFIFCCGYWYHISKTPLMNFDRYWSHIDDLGDFIRRIFGVFLCPSFQKVTFFWKSRDVIYFFKEYLGIVLYFWSVLVINKG